MDITNQAQFEALRAFYAVFAALLIVTVFYTLKR